MATTKITKGKSFLRAARYDLENGLNKDEQEKISRLPATKHEGLVPGFEQGKRARLLATNLVEGSTEELARQFDEVAKQRPGIKEPVHKVSVQIKPEEHLETHQWLEVGKSYLDEMGYKDCPFLIAQHREKDHEHIHIVTSKIDFNGNVVSDSFEKKRARKWAQSIEEKYDLNRTEEKATEKGLTRAEIEQSVKTGKIPARIYLQETVKQTLEKYQEASSFADALEKQDVSVMVRIQKDKEIVGISFGYDNKNFKGSNLGANFTWNALQEQGLNYEYERDYAKLEEASLRASGRKIDSAGFERSGIEKSNSARSAKTYDVSDGFSESDRFGGSERLGEKRTGISDTRNGTQKESRTEHPRTEPVSIASTANEQIASQRYGETARGNETKFQRTRRFDSGNIGTAERTESEIHEEITAEETDSQFTAQTVVEFDFDNEYFRQLEEERISKLFNQPSGSNIYSEPISDGENLSTQAEPPIQTGTDAGTGISLVDSNSGYDNKITVLVSDSSLPSVLVDDQSGFRNLYDIPGASPCNFLSDIVYSNDSGFLFRDNESDSRTRSDSGQVEENLSSKLRQSITDIKEAAEESLEIQERLEAEEAEKLELEKNECEIEIKLTRSLSM